MFHIDNFVCVACTSSSSLSAAAATRSSRRPLWTLTRQIDLEHTRALGREKVEWLYAAAKLSVVNFEIYTGNEQEESYHECNACWRKDSFDRNTQSGTRPQWRYWVVSGGPLSWRGWPRGFTDTRVAYEVHRAMSRMRDWHHMWKVYNFNHLTDVKDHVLQPGRLNTTDKIHYGYRRKYCPWSDSRLMADSVEALHGD